MSDLVKIPALGKRLSEDEATVETLKGLLREYLHRHRCVSIAGTSQRCDLCKRTDQQLQPKGGQ